MHGSVKVFADGEEAHRLETPDGVAIGWVRGRAIGFRGFDEEQAAVAAAAVARRALDAALRRQFPGWIRAEPAFGQLRLVHDGVDEWISDGVSALARLHRSCGATPDDPPFAIELELPSFASEGVAIAAALFVGDAIQRHVAGTVVDTAPVGAPVGAPAA